MLSENADIPRKNSYKSFCSSYLKSRGCVLDVERMLCAQRVLSLMRFYRPRDTVVTIANPCYTGHHDVKGREDEGECTCPLESAFRRPRAGTVYEHDRSCIARSPSPRFTVAGALVHPFQDTPFSLCKSRWCGSPQNLRLLSRASTVAQNTECRSEYRISRIDDSYNCSRSLGKIINRFFFDKVTFLLCFR